MADHIEQAGAEKVSINSAAVRTPDLITQVARKFGRCATVVNIDPRRVTRDGREVWEVHINGGRVPTGLEAVAYSRVVPNDSGAEYVFTQFQLPGMTDEVFAAQRAALAEELAILPILFRAQVACPVSR